MTGNYVCSGPVLSVISVYLFTSVWNIFGEELLMISYVLWKPVHRKPQQHLSTGPLVYIFNKCTN